MAPLHQNHVTSVGFRIRNNILHATSRGAQVGPTPRMHVQPPDSCATTLPDSLIPSSRDLLRKPPGTTTAREYHGQGGNDNRQPTTLATPPHTSHRTLRSEPSTHPLCPHRSREHPPHDRLRRPSHQPRPRPRSPRPHHPGPSSTRSRRPLRKHRRRHSLRGPGPRRTSSCSPCVVSRGRASCPLPPARYGTQGPGAFADRIGPDDILAPLHPAPESTDAECEGT